MTTIMMSLSANPTAMMSMMPHMAPIPPMQGLPGMPGMMQQQQPQFPQQQQQPPQFAGAQGAQQQQYHQEGQGDVDLPYDGENTMPNGHRQQQRLPPSRSSLFHLEVEHAD